MRRIVGIAIAVLLSLASIFASPAYATTATTWHVQAGSVAFASGLPLGGGNRFYPAAMAIHAGDSVVFTPVGPHTVTFNRPPVPLFALFGPINASPTAGTISSPSMTVNSGFIGGGPGTYTLTFAATLPAGRYTVICGLHIGMSELIDLLPASAHLPKTDAQYGAIAQSQITRDLDTRADTAAAAREDFQDEDGSPTVWVGVGTKRVTTIRFFPESLTVHVGQTVTFLKTKDPTEPHTVTFGAEPADPVAQLMARGGTTYSGVEDVSSGFLSTPAQYAFYHLAGLPLPVALTRYQLTFTKAGVFEYFCAIHDNEGMRATVHVIP